MSGGGDLVAPAALFFFGHTERGGTGEGGEYNNYILYKNSAKLKSKSFIKPCFLRPGRSRFWGIKDTCLSKVFQS